MSLSASSFRLLSTRNSVVRQFFKISVAESRTHSIQLKIEPNPITIIMKKNKMHQIQGYLKKQTQFI